MARTTSIDALREQASFVMRYERLDVPKRILSLVLGMGCLVHFGAPEEARIVAIFVLLFEAYGRVLRIMAPKSQDDYSLTLVYLIYARILGSVASWPFSWSLGLRQRAPHRLHPSNSSTQAVFIPSSP